MEDSQTKKFETESASENPSAGTAAKADSPANEEAVEVATLTPDSSAIGKPAGMTADSLGAKSVVTDPSRMEPASGDASSTEPSSPMSSDGGERDSRKMVPASKSRSKKKRDSLIINRGKSMGILMKWSLSNYFDLNPGYFLQFRGLMNILHLIISMVIIILLTKTCKLYARRTNVSEGFFCRCSETFMFVTAISSFLMSVMYFFCCLLSTKTEEMLYHTTLEVSYFILYAVMFIVAAFTVIMSGDQTDEQVPVKTSYNYGLAYAAGVLGLINGLFYGISSVAFFLTHKYHSTGEPEIRSESI